MNDMSYGASRFGNDRMTPPVREGEELDVTIESVGTKGDGVAKVEGFVLFVPSTNAGDRVRVKVTRVLPKVGFASVVGEGAPAEEAETPAEPEPSFEANEELDTEDFGDEGENTEDSQESDEISKEENTMDEQHTGEEQEEQQEEQPEQPEEPQEEQQEEGEQQEEEQQEDEKEEEEKQE